MGKITLDCICEYIMEDDAAQKQKEKEERNARKKAKQEAAFKEKCKKEYFDAYDVNKDGILQKSELKKFVDDICEKSGMPPFKEDFFNEIFKDADADKNNGIDFDEFMIKFGKYCP